MQEYRNFKDLVQFSGGAADVAHDHTCRELLNKGLNLALLKASPNYNLFDTWVSYQIKHLIFSGFYPAGDVWIPS